MVSILTLSSRKASHSIALPASGELLFLKLTQGFVFQETGICSLNSSFLGVLKHGLLTSPAIPPSFTDLRFPHPWHFCESLHSLKSFQVMTEGRNLIHSMFDLVFSYLLSVIFPNPEISLPIAIQSALSLAASPFLVSDGAFFFFFKGRLSGFIFFSTNHHFKKCFKL